MPLTRELDAGQLSPLLRYLRICICFIPFSPTFCFILLFRITRLLTLPMRPYLPGFYIVGFPVSDSCARCELHTCGAT